MIEYIALGLGAAVGAGGHLYERELERENLQAGEENKKMSEKSMAALETE